MKTWRKDRWKGIATSDYDRQRQTVKQTDGAVDRKDEKVEMEKKGHMERKVHRKITLAVGQTHRQIDRDTCKQRSKQTPSRMTQKLSCKQDARSYNRRREAGR